MGEEKQVNEAAKELSKLGASKGGVARAKKLSPEERSEIARLAVETRWEKAGKYNNETKMFKADYVGKLHLGEKTIPCAVLNDGTRVLSERSVAQSLGKKGGGAHWQRKKSDISGALLPEYVSAKILESYISEETKEKLLNPISYKSKTGGEAKGIPATLLPEICDIWLKARDNGALTTESQKTTAKNAEMLLRAFAHVGIIALVDEATGYQEIRDRIALQQILDKYLTDEWAKWTKTFPDDYYKDLFRLKNIPYPPVPSTTKKPSYVGHWTNDIIYDRLAPGVKKALKEKNPRLPSGFRGRKHHQYLTRDYGHPELTDLLSNVIFLMKSCSDWDDFKERLNRAKPKYGKTLLLDFKK